MYLQTGSYAGDLQGLPESFSVWHCRDLVSDTFEVSMSSTEPSHCNLQQKAVSLLRLWQSFVRLLSLRGQERHGTTVDTILAALREEIFGFANIAGDDRKKVSDIWCFWKILGRSWT